MRRKRFPRKRKRTTKRGRGIPYIYKNRIYLGKRRQTGSGAVSRVIACLLETSETLLAFNGKKKIGLSIERNPKEKKENIKHKKVKVWETHLSCDILLVNSGVII